MAGEGDLVLVVDDIEVKRYVIGSWLRRAGHRVVEAVSGAQALERLADTPVNLVILDVRLPDISGIEVCARIKADARTAAIPVIHISATAVAVADRTHGLYSGADAYLVEPIDPEVFVATVTAMLRYSAARQRAERMADRLERLTRATHAMNSADTVDELAEATVRGAASIFGAGAVVYILPMDGRVRRMVAQGPGRLPRLCSADPESLTDLSGLAPDDRPGTSVVRIPAEAYRAMVPDASTGRDLSMVISRTKEGRPPVCVGIEAPDGLGQEDMNLLRQLGQSLALAVEAQRSYAEEHLLALTLQRSLLPARLPVVPGLTYAVRYQPADGLAEVGGDFYEVLTVGDLLLVAIGDVQGHSLHAATVMAELRHALRAFVDEGHGPAEILSRLNSVLLRYHDDQTATICIVLLDPRDGTLEIANSGHPPPLLFAPGQADYARKGGVLIGFPGGRSSTEHTVIPAGGGLVLFTDGLIEGRDRTLQENLELLRALVADRSATDVEELSDRILAGFDYRTDDVALVVLRRHRTPGR
ncbi:MAG: fused response regulator/phosphatase [Streptosporangiaceae bacterium]